MGVVIKQSFKSTIIQYIGFAVGYINFTLLIPLILSPDEYGMISSIHSAAKIIAPVVILGINTAVIRYSSHFMSRHDRHYFNGFISFIPIVTFSVTTVILILLKDEFVEYYSESPEIEQYLHLVFVMVIGITAASVYSAYIRSKLNLFWPNLIDKVIGRLLLTLVLLLYLYNIFTQYDLLVNLYAYTFLLTGIIMIAASIHLFDFRINFSINYFKRNIFKSILTFSAFNVLTVLGYELVNYLNVLMLGAYKGLEEAGIYHIAFFIGTIIDLPQRSIGQISSPLLAQSLKDNKLDEVKELYEKSSINLFIAGAFIFLVIWLNVDNLFAIIPNGENWASGAVVIFFIGLGKVISMATGVNSQIISNSPHYKMNLVGIAVLAAVLLGLNFLLIPAHGIKGAAISSAAALVAFNLFKYFYIIYKFKLQPFNARTIYALLTASVCFIAVSAIPDLQNPFIDGFIKTLAVTVIFSAALLSGKLSPDMENQLRKILGKFKIKP